MWPFKKKIKEHWRLVKTQEAYITWTDDGNRQDTIVYYLYESNIGNRRVEYKATGLAGEYDKGATHPMYIKSMYPWIKGMDIQGVPSYWDVMQGKHEEHIQELYRRILKFKELHEARK